LDSISTWLTEYRVDGFRWDSTSNIRGIDGQGTVPGGQPFLQQGNALIRSLRSGSLSIAEDLKGDSNLTLASSQGGLGFDAQWDGFGYVVRDAVLANSDSQRNVLAVRDSIAGSYNGDAFQRVLFTENHDLSGNESNRLPNLIDSADPSSAAARKRSMLAAGVMLTTPGVPMLFMGQEFLEQGAFTDPPPALDWSKETQFALVEDFYRDMIRLRRNLDGYSPTLKSSKVDVYHVNDSVKVIAYKRWDKGGDEVIVVANFGSTKYARYDVGLPSAGTWHVRVNSDDKKYSIDFDGSSSDDVVALDLPLHGMPNTGPIALGSYSVVVLSK
jgi:1,4-alpha-glucan branching enzyme